jgi:dephospho-CoA kinase
MTKVLITGMSGTGKSTVLVELSRRGYRVLDTDDPGWSVDVATPDGGIEHRWVEGAVAGLLATDGTLFVSGAASNQVDFYDRFDVVILLSAPLEVILHRIATRETNPFGTTDEERDRIIQDHTRIEPLLRGSSDREIDTRASVEAIADEIVTASRLARSPGPERQRDARSSTDSRKF